MRVLTTTRLTLRPLSWEVVCAIVADRRMADWADDYPTAGDRLVADKLHGAAGDVAGGDGAAADATWGHWQVVERSTGQAIGGIGFRGRPAHGRVEVGYGLAPSRHGQGYATEALQAVVAAAPADLDGVVTIEAGTDLDNTASQRVLEKVGFQLVERADMLRYALDIGPGAPVHQT